MFTNPSKFAFGVQNTALRTQKALRTYRCGQFRSNEWHEKQEQAQSLRPLTSFKYQPVWRPTMTKITNIKEKSKNKNKNGRN